MQQGFEIGKSVVAGLAGLLAALADPIAGENLRFNGESRILLFGSDGAPDRTVYDKVLSSRWS